MATPSSAATQSTNNYYYIRNINSNNISINTSQAFSPNETDDLSTIIVHNATNEDQLNRSPSMASCKQSPSIPAYYNHSTYHAKDNLITPNESNTNITSSIKAIEHCNPGKQPNLCNVQHPDYASATPTASQEGTQPHLRGNQPQLSTTANITMLPTGSTIYSKGSTPNNSTSVMTTEHSSTGKQPTNRYDNSPVYATATPTTKRARTSPRLSSNQPHLTTEHPTRLPQQTPVEDPITSHQENIPAAPSLNPFMIFTQHVVNVILQYPTSNEQQYYEAAMTAHAAIHNLTTATVSVYPHSEHGPQWPSERSITPSNNPRRRMVT